MKLKDILVESESLSFYFFFNDEKWVAKSYKDVNALKRHLKLKEIEDENKFIKRASTGKKCFAYINPFMDDVHNQRILSWAVTQKKADDDFTQDMNDI